MSECSLSWRGQGHVNNFYIVDLENFATASRRYTGDRLQLNFQLHRPTIGLVRTCRISSYPRESFREGLCNHRRWFVCLSVCLFVCLSVCYYDN